MQMLMNMDGYDDNDVNGVPRAGNKIDTTYHVWDPRTNTVSISALLFAEKPCVWNIFGMNQLRQFLQWVTVLRVLTVTITKVSVTSDLFQFQGLGNHKRNGFRMMSQLHLVLWFLSFSLNSIKQLFCRIQTLWYA